MDEQLDNKRDKNVDLTKEIVPGTGPIDSLKALRDVYGGGDEDELLLRQFRHRMHRSWNYWVNNWSNARDDLDFAYNEQWTAADIDIRTKQKRPMLTINLLPTYINHVVGQVRQSKLSIQVKQKGSVSEKIPLYSDPNQKLTYADIMAGLVRDIEGRSDAPYLYARAVQHAIESGFGWLYVRTVLPRDDPREIEIRIEQIQDRFSVLFDPLVEDSNFGDAKWACMTKKMSIMEFFSEYPEYHGFTNSINTGAVGLGSNTENYGAAFSDWWGSGDFIRVNDYYYFEPVKRTTVTYKNQEGEEIWGFEKDIGDMHDDLLNRGYMEVERKEVETDQLMYMRCIADKILTKPKAFPSTIIPIVPLLGRLVDIGECQTNYFSDSVRKRPPAYAERLGNRGH